MTATIEAPASEAARSDWRDVPCKPWTGRRNRQGYGVLHNPHGSQLAHKAAYEREVGPVPEGTELDHLCRRRECVEVRHLEPVTHAENCRRGAAAKLTPELVRYALARPESSVAVGRRLGVDGSTIRRIRLGTRWKGVA